jgi:hypothetical protein
MVVLQQDAARLAGLNVVGARVWELIDGRRSVDQIAGVIAEEFLVGSGDALTDVCGFVAELAREQLVELSDAAALVPDPAPKRS